MDDIPTGWAVALAGGGAAASVVSAIFGNAVWPEIIFRLTRRGRAPTKRPIRVWFGFWISSATTIVLASVLASSAVRSTSPASTTAGLLTASPTGIAQPQVYISASAVTEFLAGQARYQDPATAVVERTRR